MRQMLARLLTVIGFLSLPLSANASAIAIDEIIVQGGGNSSVLTGTADFSVVGSTLTIVLTNTSSGATGGPAATNLLTGIGFNLPSGITIANSGTINHVAISAGSTAVNFGGSLSDTSWGAGNNPKAINNLTVSGDVNAAAATLQAFIEFDLAGSSQPPANVDGPGYGLLSTAVAGAGGLPAVQSSLTLTLALDGSVVPGTLVDQIQDGWVVLTFGSPTPVSVPEPSTLTLMGVGLVGLIAASFRNRLFNRAGEPPSAS